MIEEIKPHVLKLLPSEVLDFEARLPTLSEAESLIRGGVIRTFNPHDPHHEVESEGPYMPKKSGLINSMQIWPGNHLSFRGENRQIAAIVTVPFRRNPRDMVQDLKLVYLYRQRQAEE